MTLKLLPLPSPAAPTYVAAVAFVVTKLTTKVIKDQTQVGARAGQLKPAGREGGGGVGGLGGHELSSRARTKAINTVHSGRIENKGISV